VGWIDGEVITTFINGTVLSVWRKNPFSYHILYTHRIHTFQSDSFKYRNFTIEFPVDLMIVNMVCQEILLFFRIAKGYSLSWGNESRDSVSKSLPIVKLICHSACLQLSCRHYMHELDNPPTIYCVFLELNEGWTIKMWFIYIFFLISRLFFQNSS
jgi:hypothetical protein